MAEKPDTAKGSTEIVELSKLEQTTARRVAESKATVPHVYLETSVDGKGLPLEAAIRACGLALREHRRLNGAYRDGKLELYSRVNVGFATKTEKGSLIPTVFDADAKSLDEIAGEVGELSARAAGGSITQPELAGGTFTVATVGVAGISAYAGIVEPGQAGFLALGEERATLSCDARITDGVAAGKFLARVRELLEDPAALRR